MEEDLIAILLSDPGVAALAGTRINLTQSPQKTASPRVVVTRISGDRDYHMTGPSGLVESRVQCDCFAMTWLAAKNLARAIEAKLSGYAGTRNATRFEMISVVGERDDYFDADTTDKLYRTSLDFTLWHKGA